MTQTMHNTAALDSMAADRAGLDPVALASAAGDQLTATDLGELLGAFNDITAKLQISHDQLTAEVSRLRGQLQEADDQLQRSRRLAALGEMAAGIAHEIRNPLGSIGLYARMLAEDLEDRPDEQVVATKIGRAVRGLNAIVTDVLAFAGESRMRVMPVLASDLLESAVEQAGIEDSSSAIEVAIELPDGDMELVCDQGKLVRALVNIIRNGIEAIEEADRLGAELATSRGPARLTVAAVVAELPGVEAVAISVRDTGTGLRGGVTERMFNPFYTTREVGTGLGLAIVHSIVDAHGGRVSVSNNGPSVGDGATVEILIPIRQAAAARTTTEDGRIVA